MSVEQDELVTSHVLSKKYSSGQQDLIFRQETEPCKTKILETSPVTAA